MLSGRRLRTSLPIISQPLLELDRDYWEANLSVEGLFHSGNH